MTSINSYQNGYLPIATVSTLENDANERSSINVHSSNRSLRYGSIIAFLVVLVGTYTIYDVHDLSKKSTSKSGLPYLHMSILSSNAGTSEYHSEVRLEKDSSNVLNHTIQYLREPYDEGVPNDSISTDDPDCDEEGPPSDSKGPKSKKKNQKSCKGLKKDSKKDSKGSKKKKSKKYDSEPSSDFEDWSVIEEPPAVPPTTEGTSDTPVASQTIIPLLPVAQIEIKTDAPAVISATLAPEASPVATVTSTESQVESNSSSHDHSNYDSSRKESEDNWPDYYHQYHHHDHSDSGKPHHHHHYNDDEDYHHHHHHHSHGHDHLDDDEDVNGGTDYDDDVTLENDDELDSLHRKKHSHKSKHIAPQAVYGLQLQSGYPSTEVQLQYAKDLDDIDWDDVEKDLKKVLTDSQEWWPADYGNYGPFFIRLAWHSCGSYRASDGRGGCDGGAQRFDPERSWPDNTNLDKARRLLQPIKLKYGNGLSWGDLFALVGTVAIKAMGGPDVGFCAGRLDVDDNSQTIALGPSAEQDKFAHCEVNGQCPFPLGSNTIGLIYVNPEGPMGEPDILGAANTIREVFGRMDWDGRELVALIGGGHTFGKAHGASTVSNGDPPETCPFAAWNGPVGVDAITSGFEGPWTSEPTKWDNKYFQYLMNYKWAAVVGPGGHWQWQIKGDGPDAPTANPHDKSGRQKIIMLTTDMALKKDPEYKLYAAEFASNETAFKEAFGKAWYKLVTRDVGPATRCAGNPPKPKHFQHPLPDPHKLADMHHVEKDLKKLMKHSKTEQDFVRLAYQCASTFRATDYAGGCNGARIRFPPGSDWPVNAGLNETIALLEPIKEQYGKGLSYADLFVLAGNIAAERLGSPKVKFCPGRTDDIDGSAWKHLAYGISDPPTSVDQIIELIHRRGQTYKDFVALTFPRFQSAKKLRKALEAPADEGDFLLKGLQYYPELRYWAEHIASASDKDVYGELFAASWTRLMNADRFDGPVGNVCG